MNSPLSILLLILCASVLLASNIMADEKTAREGCPYPTQHDAAAAILNSMNPISIRENKEYGGYLYHIAANEFCFSNAVTGDYGRVNFFTAKKNTPSQAEITATWHTHGAAMKGIISEIFSPQDIKQNQRERLDGYLATPSGSFKFIPYGSHTTQLLGSVATVATQ